MIEAKLIDEKTKQEHKLIEGNSYVIGRSHLTDIITLDSSESVSRFHCAIKYVNEEGKWYLVDLRSRYGTEVISGISKDRVVYEHPTELNDNDIIILARKYKFKFVCEK